MALPFLFVSNKRHSVVKLQNDAYSKRSKRLCYTSTTRTMHAGLPPIRQSGIIQKTILLQFAAECRKEILVGVVIFIPMNLGDAV